MTASFLHKIIKNAPKLKIDRTKYFSANKIKKIKVPLPHCLIKKNA
jgi:hypothetical protein